MKSIFTISRGLFPRVALIFYLAPWIFEWFEFERKTFKKGGKQAIRDLKTGEYIRIWPIFRSISHVPILLHRVFCIFSIIFEYNYELKYTIYFSLEDMIFQDGWVFLKSVKYYLTGPSISIVNFNVLGNMD